MTRARRLAFALALAAGLAIAAPRPAAAGGLTQAERQQLEAGENVIREIDFEVGEERYVGGVGYVLVDAPPAEVMAALHDPKAFYEILPLVMEAKPMGTKGNDRLVYFRHGGSAGSASYVCQVRYESDRVVRFWLDPSQPHDFDDSWGYFKVADAPGGKTLLTYGGVINLGWGLVRMLFEERVRDRMLETPLLVRNYVEKLRRQGG